MAAAAAKVNGPEKAAAAAASKVDGQEKVLAAAHHIVKSIAGSNADAAEDMMRILSGFDNRLSDLFTSTPSDASPEELRLEEVEELLNRWDSSDSLLFESAPEDASEFLAAVDDAITIAEEGDDYLQARAETAVQVAMARLEDEFRHLVVRNTVPLDPASLSFDLDDNCSDPDSEGHAISYEPKVMDAADLIQPEAVGDLRLIADRMIAAGYGKELCQVYSSVRRDVLDECLLILGIDKMSIDEVQRIEWETLSNKMHRWIQAVRVVVRVLLLGERRLCDQIFADFDELKAECFTDAGKSCVMQLLIFGEAVAITRRSPEKLFRILGMYEALADVMPDLQAMFPGEPGVVISADSEGILKSLGDAVRGTFNEFVNAVHKDNSRKPMQSGEIHPLTSYVMNYVKLLVDFRDPLDLLMDESGTDGGGDSAGGSEGDDRRDLGSMSPWGRRLLLLISYLEANLEEKSKLYEDPALQYIFLMNNIHYIVQKVKNSEPGTILGERWVRRHRGQIRQYATSYIRASWAKVLSYLKDDGFGGSGGSGGSSNNASRMALKEKFKNFNLAFEEIYRTQTTWKVPDPQFREELRIMISEKLLPAYRSFVGKFRGQLEGGRNTGKYIKYTSDDLENYLMDLFEGLPGGLPNLPRWKLSGSI